MQITKPRRTNSTIDQNNKQTVATVPIHFCLAMPGIQKITKILVFRLHSDKIRHKIFAYILLFSLRLRMNYRN